MKVDSECMEWFQLIRFRDSYLYSLEAASCECSMWQNAGCLYAFAIPIYEHIADHYNNLKVHLRNFKRQVSRILGRRPGQELRKAAI
jgi:hypothetical protein